LSYSPALSYCSRDTRGAAEMDDSDATVCR